MYNYFADHFLAFDWLTCYVHVYSCFVYIHCMYMCIYIQFCILYICKHMHILVCMYVCMYVCMCVYVCLDCHPVWAGPAYNRHVCVHVKKQWHGYPQWQRGVSCSSTRKCVLSSAGNVEGILSHIQQCHTISLYFIQWGSWIYLVEK